MTKKNELEQESWLSKLICFYGCRFSSRCEKKILGAKIAFLLLSSSNSVHADLWFNPRFLGDDPTSVADLSSFEKGLEVPEGNYRVDIYVNNDFFATKDIYFKMLNGEKKLYPCLTYSQLSAMNVNIDLVENIKKTSTDECIFISKLIKDATFSFDVGQQRLYLTFPQTYMGNRTRGFIPPEMWDNGITAGLVNYNFTGNEIKNKNGKRNSYAYLNYQSGVNAGPWRLRDNSIWSYSSVKNNLNNSNKIQHVNTWIERDIKLLRSRLTFGDAFTNGDIFDGINFRGIQIASDDNMLPESQRGFAPVVRGIAKTTAQVYIKQNGYEIYRTTVPPGPFAINDLYATGNGGNLLVTIEEADGNKNTFAIAYSSVPILQRDGYSRYSFTVGKYRSGNRQQETPSFIQSTILKGLSNDWTLYGGTQLANRFSSLSAGIGKNVGSFGALSLDLTQANATLPDDSKHQGQSLRFLYNKSLADIGTNIQLVGYRYSTRGYYNFADTTYSRMSGYDIKTQDGVIHIKPSFNDYYNLAFKKRGRIQLNLTQQLGRNATFYVSSSHQTYWNSKKIDKQLQAGLNATFDDINWSLSYSLNKNAWQQERDEIISANVNIPFSHWTRSDSKSIWKNGNASYSMSTDHNGRTNSLAGLYGTLLEDNNLNYSVQTGYTSNNDIKSSYSGYTSLNYKGGFGNFNLGYSHSEGVRQLFYGMSGGMLAHSNGVTFSQPMNDTVVLVEVPGAANVRIENQTGVYTDWRGYAVLPFASDYRENRIALDTNSLADNIDLEEPIVSVVPSHGAIVRAKFRAFLGLKLLITVNYMRKAVPFGAIATSANNKQGSIVGDGGQVYMNGMPQSGIINVKWGDGFNSSCIAEYSLPDESLNNPINQIAVTCK
ncbi:fimbria/pilus outer membrane usher protein [Klebsiella sp. CN_Kp116]|uniref:fimbria/pilus outer membrane usher protein n=1 Tax=unclassified Klebsiella TaxID=2608929 RepID=UPI0032B43D38